MDTSISESVGLGERGYIKITYNGKFCLVVSNGYDTLQVTGEHKTDSVLNKIGEMWAARNNVRDAYNRAQHG